LKYYSQKNMTTSLSLFVAWVSLSVGWSKTSRVFKSAGIKLYLAIRTTPNILGICMWYKWWPQLLNRPPNLMWMTVVSIRLSVYWRTIHFHVTVYDASDVSIEKKESERIVSVMKLTVALTFLLNWIAFRIIHLNS